MVHVGAGKIHANPFCTMCSMRRRLSKGLRPDKTAATPPDRHSLAVYCQLQRRPPSIGTTADQATMPGHGIRLLALDGGGVRGLSSLMMLQQLMAAANRESPPKPCDYFDMIGGTSTGGFIAIMLGRLQMTIDECIDAYTLLFGARDEACGRFSASQLEQVAKQIVRSSGFDQDTLLRDSPHASCKVYVYSNSPGDAY